MSNYKRILVALDLKPEDDELVSGKALSLAKASGGEVNVIHVVEPIYNYGIPPGTESKFDEWETEIEQTAKLQLEKIGQKLSIPADKQYISVGQIKRQILYTAKKINADLIVVGTHSRHGLSSLFMGHTSDEMLHHSECDVLAVHIPSNG